MPQPSGTSRRGKYVRVHGQSVREVREQLFLTQDAFGKAIGMTVGGVARIERAFQTGITNDTLLAMSTLVGSTPAGLLARIGVTDEAGPQPSASDANVEPLSEQPLLAEIPFFDLPIAAGQWESVTDNEDGGYRLTLPQMAQGLFRVRVRGDSMRPRYPDGCVVEFKLMRTAEGVADCDRVTVGKRYYVQLDDGTGTFKELAGCDENGLSLRATNRKYKRELLAPFERIVRLAVAVGKVELDE
jgi:transcriptional regulator with XRE-family HTH domain